MTTLTPMATKRIARDIRLCSKESKNLEKEGIYFFADESQMNILRAMFIGPEMSYNPFKSEDEETPYFGGYYFFLIKFPSSYPFDPMQVEFMTQNRNWRCNPNFYSTGKVCLSSINTWGSNEWSPERTLLELFMIIRARLDANPIRYEPGYETEEGDKTIKYNNTVRYGNWQFGVLQMINETPFGFNVFNDIMKEKFIENYQKFEDKLLKDKMKFHKRLIEGGIYGNKFIADYNSLLTSFREVYYRFTDNNCLFSYDKIFNHYQYKSTSLGLEIVNLNEEDKDMESDSSSSKEESVEELPDKVIIKKKNKRIPNENPNDYEVGFQIKSSNDNKMYQVLISKTGKKRWYRI